MRRLVYPNEEQRSVIQYKDSFAEDHAGRSRSTSVISGAGERSKLGACEDVRVLVLHRSLNKSFERGLDSQHPTNFVKIQ